MSQPATHITDTVEALGKAGLVAVIRTKQPADAVALARAVLAGGITAIEVTFTIPDAAGVIRDLVEASTPDVVIGAGTVLTPAELAAAADAGARFAMSPAVDTRVIAAGTDAGLAVVPGALTPTEVATAVAAGAVAVKLFPAATVGVDHLSALRQVYPRVRFVPTGGVGPETVRQWRSCGAFALGIGGVLNQAMRHGGVAAVHELSERLVRDWATDNTSSLGDDR